MSRTPSRYKSAHSLSPSTQRQLSMYALAAGAAGVAALAAPQAEATVVYHHVNVRVSAGSTYLLDISHNGVADFAFNNRIALNSMGAAGTFMVGGESSNQLVVSSNGCAAAVGQGTRINSQANFDAIGLSPDMAFFSSTGGVVKNAGCPWTKNEIGFLGLKFSISGQTHYGWARVKLYWVPSKGINAVLTDYAYENEANTGICVGNKGHGTEMLKGTLSDLAKGK
ncbi:MAG TPA: hypothetical protein VF753_14570 [Terriglobales bacterium]